MRRVLPLLAVGLLLGMGSLPARGQVEFGNGAAGDPFFLYYGFFLPRQAALAAQPGPTATINALSAAQQARAVTNRATLFDPLGNRAGLYSYDPQQAFGGQGRGMGRSRAAGAGYFGGAAAYFPGMRDGQSSNANVSVTPGIPGYSGRGGGFAGGYGMASPTPSFPGSGYGAYRSPSIGRR